MNVRRRTGFTIFGMFKLSPWSRFVGFVSLSGVDK